MASRKVHVGIVVLALVVLAGVSFRPSGDSRPQQARSRILELQRLVEQQAKESSEAVAAYVPRTKARIDDMTAPASVILRELPGVVNVEVLVQADRPTRRIVHLRDWHHVPRDLYALDLRNAAGRELTGDEIDAHHQEHLLEIEAVQIEQVAILRCLVRHHGLNRFFCEGFSQNKMPHYREKIIALRDIEQNQVPQLRNQLQEVRELMKGMEAAGRHDAEGYKNAGAIEEEIAGLLRRHRENLLEMGAAGRLLIGNEIDEVLPLEDDHLLDQAKPVTPAGKVRFDPAKIRARQDAQVWAVLGQGPFGLIVLGGAHDLSESIQQLGGGRCEYIRVTTRRFKEFSGAASERAGR